MKRAQFFKPGSILIERQVPREGPSPVFIAWKPHTAQSFVDEKALLKFAAYPSPHQQALTFANGFAALMACRLRNQNWTQPELKRKDLAPRLTPRNQTTTPR